MRAGIDAEKETKIRIVITVVKSAIGNNVVTTALIEMDAIVIATENGVENEAGIEKIEAIGVTDGSVNEIIVTTVTDEIVRNITGKYNKVSMIFIKQFIGVAIPQVAILGHLP